jgi:EpsI family protein
MPDDVSRTGIGRKLLPFAVLLLIVQTVFLYGVRHEEVVPPSPPLDGFPAVVGPWRYTEAATIEPEFLRILGVDQSLSRIYRDNEIQRPLNLFIAYYKTQLGTKNAHDPAECLPGAGWKPVFSSVIDLPMEGAATVPINYYLIVRDQEQNVVLYWFQTHKRVIADEQKLHLFRVWDTITDHRTDMALVRIVIPVLNDGVKIAGQKAFEFAQQILLVLPQYFPAQTKTK